MPASRKAPAIFPAGFEPVSIFFERRASGSLTRLDGRTRSPQILAECGCRIEGAVSGRPCAFVLDEPDPVGLPGIFDERFARSLIDPAGLPPPVEAAAASLAPIREAFGRWESEILAGGDDGGEIAAVRMEAALSVTMMSVARLRGAALAHVVRDGRASLEGRLSITIRSEGRAVVVESTRWALVPSGSPDTNDLRAWDGAARDALARGRLLIEAAPPPAMEGLAVFAPPAAGVLLHEICGHLLEGDLIVGRVSPFASLLGERVAPEAVTIIDDPRAPGGRVALLADDEGEETRSAVLIESGILRGFLTDARSAAASGGHSTGHARRESYRHPALPRMTNLVMSAGDRDPADLIREVTRGIFVERLGRGQVDPRRGEFRLEVESGRLIEGGEVGRPVAGGSLLGSCRDLLRSIDGIGTDATMDHDAGACIKEDQIVPVGQVTPTLRVARVRIVPGAVA